jgi:hypothetical protein
MRALLAILLILGTRLICAQTPTASASAPDDVARLKWLDTADVKADFHRVVEEQRDFRFLVVGTLSSRIPAGQYDPTDLAAKYGSRDFAIGCIISNGEGLRLRKKADAYADEYNQMLVRYLRSHQ